MFTSMQKPFSSGNKIRLLALAIGLFTTLALVLQGVLSTQSHLANGEAFFSGIWTLLGYYTFLTNGFVAALMIQNARGVMGVENGKDQARMACLTLQILIVAAVYHALLRHTWNPQGLEILTDFFFHTVCPLATVLFWWFFVGKNELRWAHSTQWMVYPTAFCLLALIRGSLSGWYPYPFLNVTKIGWSQVLINAVVLGLVIWALGLALIWLGTVVSRHRSK